MPKSVLMINGHGVPQELDEGSASEARAHYDNLISYYHSQDYKVVGDGVGGFELEDIRSHLSNVKSVRVDISAHGRIKEFTEQSVLLFDINNVNHHKGCSCIDGATHSRDFHRAL